MLQPGTRCTSYRIQRGHRHLVCTMHCQPHSRGRCQILQNLTNKTESNKSRILATTNHPAISQASASPQGQKTENVPSLLNLLPSGSPYDLFLLHRNHLLAHTHPHRNKDGRPGQRDSRSRQRACRSQKRFRTKVLHAEILCSRCIFRPCSLHRQFRS